jgi:hypothetical protein
MRYKKTTITVKETDSGKHPQLYKNWPFSSEINGKEWSSKGDEVYFRVTDYLLNNPYSHIILRTGGLGEKGRGLRKALDALVEEHNISLEKRDLTLRLNTEKKHSSLRKARRILRKAEE